MAEGSETAIQTRGAARELGRGPAHSNSNSNTHAHTPSDLLIQDESRKDASAADPTDAAKRSPGALTVLKLLVVDLSFGWMVPILLVVAWQLAAAAGWVSETFLPAPSAIWKAFVDLAGSGELLHHLGVSLQRAGTGFLIGGLLGALLGLLAGGVRLFAYLVDPSVQLLRLIPHLAIAPLIILWFGFGEVSKVAIIISGSFFPIYLNTFAGIRQADARLLEVGQVLGFGPVQKLKRIILPAAMPNMLLGIRLSLGASWIGLVVAELIGSQSGVGFLINNAKQNDNTELIFVGIVIFAVAGKLIDSVVRLFERRLLAWRDNYQG